MEKERKSEIHITNNFNAPIGQHIDHVDTIQFHMDGDGTFHFGRVENARVKKQKATRKAMPDALTSEEAEELLEDLVDAGLLDENWQPKKLSGSEKALVAKAICERLCINEVWQVFGQLWNEKPVTLRSYFNKALDQKKSLDFQEKIKKIIR